MLARKPIVIWGVMAASLIGWVAASAFVYLIFLLIKAA